MAIEKLSKKMYDRLKKRRPDLAIISEQYRKELGKYLTEQRKQREYFVTEVMQGAALTFQQITALEEGSNPYEIDSLLRYCHFLGIPMPFTFQSAWEKDYEAPDKVSDDDVKKPGDVDFEIQVPDDEFDD